MRLTKKIFTDLYASPCDEDTEEKQAEQQWKICNKLGQLEDLMEKYGFETVKDLDNFIQSRINRIEYENKKEKYL